MTVGHFLGVWIDISVALEAPFKRSTMLIMLFFILGHVSTFLRELLAL